MAVSPFVLFPAQVNGSDPDYPHGKAQNVSAPGSGDGTPWEETMVNDVLGFQQALLAETATTPSGTPDKVGASQYLDSVKAIIRKDSASTAVRNWRVSEQLSGLDGTGVDFGVAGNSEWWVGLGAATVTGSFAGLFFARDAGGTWALSTRTGAQPNSVSWDPVNGLFIACGDGGVVYTAADPSLTWASQILTAGGALNAAHTSLAGVTVVAGDFAVFQQIAFRSTNGTSYSVIAMPGSSGDKTLNIASAGTTMVAVGRTSGGDPLIWRSTDSGGAFTASAIPVGLTDALNDVTWNGAVFIILGDDGAIATSATGEDGTWTVQGGLANVESGRANSLAADQSTGVVLAIVENQTSGGIHARMQLTVDDGVSWSNVPNGPQARDGGGGWGHAGFNGDSWAIINRLSTTFQGAQSLARA